MRIWFHDLIIESNTVVQGFDNFPGNLHFYGVPGGGQVVVNSHAPDKEVEIRSNARIFGCVVGANITMRANSQLHYDESLLIGPCQSP